MTDALQDYRREAEKQYGLAIVRLITLGKEQLQAEELYHSGLTQGQRKALEQKLSTRYNNPEDAKSKIDGIEREVCHVLLYYLQTVIFVRNQNISLVGQAILENEQKRWNLDPETAAAINAIILRDQGGKPEPDYSQKWDQYYQLLFKAIQRDSIPLRENTQAQLKLLQLQLGIPESAIPLPEMLQSGRGVNYIPLWQFLKKQDWKSANGETLRCLVEAGGQQERDLQLIDVGRIPLADLKTIDALWCRFSNGRFGFSVQYDIQQKTTRELQESSKPLDWEEVGRRLDWRRNNSWIDYDFMDFSSDAVRGHLPTFPYIGWWCWVGGMEALLQRLDAPIAAT